jgi:hypothetical protein
MTTSPPPPSPLDSIPARRNRRMLLAIFALFFGSMILAGILRFSGWRPAGTRAHGELLQPPGDLRAVTPRLANGELYRWNPADRIWRIALAPPADCADPCVQLAHQLDAVWKLMGQNADHVQVLWIGEPPPGVARGGALRILQPSAELRAAFPRLQPVAGENHAGIPVYVIDPNGFVVLRYAPGLDPSGLRADLAKLTRLL